MSDIIYKISVLINLIRKLFLNYELKQWHVLRLILKHMSKRSVTHVLTQNNIIICNFFFCDNYSYKLNIHTQAIRILDLLK